MRRAVAAVVVILACATAFGEDRVVDVKVRADSEHPGSEAFKAMDGNPGAVRLQRHCRAAGRARGHPLREGWQGQARLLDSSRPADVVSGFVPFVRPLPDRAALRAHSSQDCEKFGLTSATLPLPPRIGPLD